MRIELNSLVWQIDAVIFLRGRKTFKSQFKSENDKLDVMAL